jgi:hypothetical protein
MTVRGLVGLASRVRRQLAERVSPAARDHLRRLVGERLEALDLFMQDEDLTPAAMSASSRKAYEFLKRVDFDAVRIDPDAPEGLPVRETVRITGLRGVLGHFLDRLARTAEPAALGRLHEEIRAKSEQLQELMDAEDLRPGHLKAESCAVLAWLRYFARREHFDAYVQAVARARPQLEREAARSQRYLVPVTVHFRPMKGVYRVRGLPGGTRVALPTPMICFSPEAFARVAAMAFRKGAHEQEVYEQMLTPSYQGVLAEMEAAAGEEAKSFAGVYHDLAAAFDRVNAEYFGAELPRPRLTWSRTFTMRKFGHYDAARDTVMISSSLDARDVPGFVVEFVVYHELLHKHLGVGWRSGRRAAHTPEFRRRERRFRQWQQAEAVLKRVAKAP